MSFFNVTKPVAKKEHGCYWCHTPINRSEKYTRATGSFCGDFHSTPFHPDCYDACLESDYSQGEEPWCDSKHGRGKLCECNGPIVEPQKPEPLRSNVMDKQL